MSRDIDLTPSLRNRMQSYPKKRGRYNASQFYAITHGWVTPEQWMNPDPETPEGLMRMWMGILSHDHIERLLPAECNEQKREYLYKGITLVAKADHIPNHVDEVWEFKTSEEEMDKGKPWADHQAKLYCTIFEKPKAIIYQPVQSSNGLYLKAISEIDRDDEWFFNEMEQLLQFHHRVEVLWEAKNAQVVSQ